MARHSHIRTEVGSHGSHTGHPERWEYREIVKTECRTARRIQDHQEEEEGLKEYNHSEDPWRDWA